jgi:hypothetical protein
MSTTATTTDPAAPANSRAQAMAQGRQADSARRRQRVLAALNRATATGVEISVSGIARAAGFSELKIIMDPRGVVASSLRFARRQ